MIKIEEIRSGSVVLVNGKVAHVHFLTMEKGEFKVVYMHSRASSVRDGIASIDDIEPVPLSPDLLEKCGFKQSNEFDDTFRLNQFDVFYRKTYCEWTVDDRGDNEGSKPRIFRHLHQLQNLIYAVTGSELTITL